MPEKKGSKGYLIPEVIDPQDYICLSVLIPNAPEYLYAFSGAYERLGTWQSWEKDGTNRASQVAQVWKNAIDETRANYWLKGVFMSCDNFQELVDAIINLKIEVNAGGGGCCNALRDYRMPDGWEDDQRWMPPPVHDTTPAVGANDYMCDGATWAFDLMVEYMETFAQASKEESPYEWLFDALYLIPFAIPVVEYFWDSLTTFIATEYGDFVEQCRQCLMDNKNDIICAIAYSPSASAAVQNVLSNISSSDCPFHVVYWLEKLYGSGSWTFNGLYNATATIPAEYFGSSCDCAPTGAGFDVTYEYATNTETWATSARAGWSSQHNGSLYHAPRSSSANSSQWMGRNTFSGDNGQPVGDSVYLTQVTIKVIHQNPTQAPPDKHLEFTYWDELGQGHSHVISGLPANTETDIVIPVGQYILNGDSGEPNDNVFELIGHHNGQDEPQDEFFIMSIRFEGVFTQ